MVGLPSIYTMELWWHGIVTSPAHILVALCIIVALNIGVCYATAFHQSRVLRSATAEAVSSVVLALCVDAALLLLIEAAGSPPNPAVLLRQTVLAALPTSLGVTFANTYLSDSIARPRTPSRDDEQDPDPYRLQLKSNLLNIAASFVGGLIYATNIALTAEVIKIATRLSAWQCLLMGGVSIGLSYLILAGAGFHRRYSYVSGWMQWPWSQAALNYTVCLLTSGLLLFISGHGDVFANPRIATESLVTLGLLTTVGGATGRLFV